MSDDLDSLVSQMVERGISYLDAVREFEKRFIEATLGRNEGNQSKAARALGIHRNTLKRKVEDLALNGRARPHKKRPRR